MTVETAGSLGAAVPSPAPSDAGAEPARRAPSSRPAGTRLPRVAVIGRPNVGKSSLVNRIVGRRAAIVEGTPGVTRDRNVLAASWNGVDFELVDTGGYVESGSLLDRQVAAQAAAGAESAELLLLVLDATVGITEEDLAVAELVRRRHWPVLVVANKVDAASRESDAWELAGLGLGDPWMVSALHGRGSGDLLDEVVRRLERVAPRGSVTDAGSPAGGEESVPEPGPGRDGWPSEPESAPERDGGAEVTPPAATGLRSAPFGPGAPAEPATKVPSVAVVGRPNVGKSTLFNRLVGEERSVIHDLPGTTTDAVDTLVETSAGSIRFVDTAGLRRKARIGDGVEYYSLVRALQAIDLADVALLVLDASEGVTHQDQRLAERVDAAGCPVVIVANKWDLLSTEERSDVRRDVADRLGFLSYAPLLPTSALSGLGVHRLLPAISSSLSAYARRVPTRELNQVVQAAQRRHPAPDGRVLYATQGGIEPPTITLFATRALAPTWLRYLERSIREHFALGPTPIELRVRRRDDGPKRGRR